MARACNELPFSVVPAPTPPTLPPGLYPIAAQRIPPPPIEVTAEEVHGVVVANKDTVQKVTHESGWSDTSCGDDLGNARELILHDYNSTLIAQRPQDGYVNATAMCQAHGKLFNDYSRTQFAERFAEALASDTGIPVSDLVVVRKGGASSNQGTWVHPQVALHLAMWCSPAFAVWATQHLLDWMKAEPAQPTFRLPQNFAEALRLLADRTEENEHLKIENATVAEVNARLEEDVQFEVTLRRYAETTTLEAAEAARKAKAAALESEKKAKDMADIQAPAVTGVYSGT